MIRTKTLFVLGAGASQPYGLPLGSELRTLICEAIHEANTVAQAIVEGGYFTRSDIYNVAIQFLRSNIRSIDEFLGRLPHLAEVGKTLIAANICTKEVAAEIFAEDNPDHWYRLLWAALTDDTMNGNDLLRSNVRFITFYYDRSLEYFLHQSTMHSYGLNDDAAHGISAKIPIMHVYGSVGEYGGANGQNNTRPYTAEIRPRELGVAAAGINIIPEGRDNDDVFKMARNWFNWAERVYVLGFGFDRLNCNRLNFPSVLSSKSQNRQPPPNIVASVLGFTAAEVARSQQRLLEAEGSWATHNANNTMTLRMSGFPD